MIKICLLMIFFISNIFSFDDLIKQNGNAISINPFKTDTYIENQWIKSEDVSLLSPNLNLDKNGANLNNIDILSINSLSFENRYLSGIKLNLGSKLDKNENKKDYIANNDLSLQYQTSIVDFIIKTQLNANYNLKEQEAVLYPNLDISREILYNTKFGTIIKSKNDEQEISPYIDWSLNKNLNINIMYSKPNDESQNTYMNFTIKY
ncbi:hypothetical protein [Campylobacter hyointestinalis]|uniref:DUF481 domain-containing protein n=1 Tax=Campylobacter hyointestinalis subsp. hyointestinalis TaxID=91352 RepID=A0A855N379_CAMHY|nr:hypothetical protein [Campylobacter hyointestinalis]KEA44181.1 hypothetical protein CR67_04945 [Campylobacter hyointestinalis subsp. hyointestinalis]MBT0611916.1 hypothetical protein [Campylobacter hyointestinalis subsp. hyointestinalis]MDY2999287.1 hypothetical protein [Campylobacter hyointestinalis]PPB59474.1 hypothetical protein CDQ70_04360 [Campylobacter hyointestinalis subsp. hyointestinalis]PPB64311.1 hypothetical protein CDQ74_02265 [Campylobacter hyointestinalis subsp. hyointestinal